MTAPEPATPALHCTHCRLPLHEPRSYVHVIGRSVYHFHCAMEIARSRATVAAVPTPVAHALVQATLPWRLLECGFRLEPRDAWWGLFVDRRDVRLILYLCFIPFVPLRLVLGPRLRHAIP